MLLYHLLKEDYRPVWPFLTVLTVMTPQGPGPPFNTEQARTEGIVKTVKTVLLLTSS